MPKKIPQFLSYFLEDCLNWNSSFSVKSMFGWYWIYKDWKIFALYAFDEIYFKVWENNIYDYKNHNSRVFEYDKKWKIFTMSYYTLPEEILEHFDELELWIEKSLEVENKCNYSKKSKKDLEIDRKILEKLLEIPKWKVTTYKILADIFNVHSRKIASVMKQNKNPEIFPCYKVISHSLKISWYSWPNWVQSKVEMLENDWIKIIDWKIDRKYIYNF